MENVILVNDKDEEIGICEKIKAHVEGKKHRAFSVFIFNNKGQLLIQKRAKCKYHCPGLLTNSCCSHPRQNEDILDAGKRRLQEELGFTCEVKEVDVVKYNFSFNNGLSENEIDHILIGNYSGEVNINKSEVESYEYLDLDFLEKDILKNKEKYTPWFIYIFKNIKTYIEKLV